MAVPDIFTYDDELELRGAGAEAAALKAIKPGSRSRFLTALGSAPAVTGKIDRGDRGGPQSLHSYAREGGSQFVDWTHFINTVSNLTAYYGAEFPMSWFAKQNLRDLEHLNALTDGGFKEMIEAKRTALERTAQFALDQSRLDRHVKAWADFEATGVPQQRESQVDEMAPGLDRMRERLIGDTIPSGTTADLAVRIGQTSTDTLEERQARIRAWLEEQPVETLPSLTYWDYFWSTSGPAPFLGDAGAFVGTAMGGFVDLIDGLATLEAGTNDLINEGQWNGTKMQARLDKAAALAEQSYQEQVEAGLVSEGWGDTLLATNPGLSMEVQAGYIVADDLWEMQRQENPELLQDMIMGWGGGNEEIAKQIFWQQIRDDPIVRVAAEDLENEMSAAEWEHLEALREPDTAENIRAEIARYGEWTERNGTYLLSLFGEGFGMLLDDTEHFNLGEVNRRATENRHTYGAASNYMGINGTLLGLGLDIAMWTVGDPLSIIGSPRLGMSAAKAFSKVKVEAFVRSPMGRAHLQDMVLVARSGARPEMGTVALLDELDAVGLGDEFYDLVGGRTPVLPRGTWQNGPRGRAAVEVQSEKLADALGAYVVPDPKIVKKLTEEGIDSPITVFIDDAEGVAYLGRDEATLLASLRETGETAVPIVLKQGDVLSATADDLVHVGALDELGWKTPRKFNTDGYASVRGALPESAVYGDLDWDALTDFQRRAMLLGAGTSSPYAAMLSWALPSEVKTTFREIADGKAPWHAVNRWFSRDEVTTGFTWTGKTSSRKVRHDIMKLFGDMPDMAEGFLREWRELLRGRANRTNTARKTKAQIAELKGKVKDYETRGLTPGHPNFGATADDIAIDNELRTYADEGFAGEVTPPHEEMALGFVVPGNARPIQTVGEYKMYSKGVAGGDKGREWMLVDAEGRVVVGMRELADGGGTIWVDPSLRGSGVLDEAVEGVRSVAGDRAVKRMLHAWTKDPSQTAAGSRALRKLVQKELGDSPLRPRVDTPEARAAFTEEYEALGADDAAEAAAKHADEVAAYNAARAEIDRLEAELADFVEPDNIELNNFMVKLWETYNREVIAPTGNYIVGDDGLVPWAELRPGSAAGDYSIINDGKQIYLPDTVQARLQAEEALFAGRSGEEFALYAFGPLRNPQGWNAPLSILDMHAAATLSRSQFLAYKSEAWFDFIRSMTHSALRLWKIDKVFRPATMIVATFDELFRFWHTFGPRTFFTWMDDKMRSFSESVTRSDGTHKLVGRWERRAQEMEDALPQEWRARGRHFDEAYGEGFATILPKEKGHIEAAERWTAQALGDSGFRAALISDESFNTWWDTHPDAEGLKRGSTLMPDGRVVPNSLMRDEIRRGYLNFFDKVFMHGSTNTTRTMAAWADVARQIEATGGSATRATLPKWALKEVGPVTGIRGVAPGAGPITNTANSMMDWMFLRPAQYRERFLAAQVRRYERKRLETLYHSQGLKIVPDEVIEEVTGGLHGITRHSQEWGNIEEIAREFGVVPESWVERLAENKAVEEAAHMMYAWHKTSRIGRSAAGQATVPFGGPWADMWGYYGREMLMPMASRGLFDRRLLRYVGQAIDPVKAMLPGMKTMATVSKVAATDFNIDNSWLPDFDLSPMFFLPTEGENAFMTLLPGFGAIPMIFLDAAIRAMADPMDEPERHQFIIDQVAEFIPSIGFQQQQAGRIFGGGTTASIAKIGSDISGAIGAGFYQPIHDMIGDIGAELDTTRNVRALLADPEEWADLTAHIQGEVWQTAFNGLISEAYRKGAGAHAAETVVRQFVPARGDFDESADELLNVWLDSAREYELLGVPGLDQLDMTDDDSVREMADTIRNKFWDLPQHERDFLVVSNPALAVNMVGGWQWTPSAAARLPEEAGTPYRSMGGQEGLARHQTFIKEGLIRPLDPAQVAYGIMGSYFDARERLAQRVYTLTVQDRNNWAWETQIPDDLKAWFDNAAQAPAVREFLTEGAGKELWESWAVLSDLYEEGWMRANGVDPETADDEIKETYHIPATWEPAWSRVWRGLNDENFSQRFNEVIIPTLNEEAVEILNLLGASVDMESGITGQQLISVIHQSISDDVVRTPAKVRSGAEHGTSMSMRGQPSTEAEARLHEAKINDRFDPSFRSLVDELLVVRDQNSEMMEVYGRIPPDRINLLRKKWGELRVRGEDQVFDFDEVWKDMFRRQYGPQDWTPPVPPENPVETLNMKRIRSVLDGDTLVIELEGRHGKLQRVRLLGIDAAESSTERGREQSKQLKDAMLDTISRGGSVQLIPDTEATGGRYTDVYGRLLAWLYLDGVAYYFPEEIRP